MYWPDAHSPLFKLFLQKPHTIKAKLFEIFWSISFLLLPLRKKYGL